MVIHSVFIIVELCGEIVVDFDVLMESETGGVDEIEGLWIIAIDGDQVVEALAKLIGGGCEPAEGISQG